MTDIEKRAHDIAVRLLPEILHDENIEYFVRDPSGAIIFNDYEILSQYDRVYEGLLKGLQNFAGI